MTITRAIYNGPPNGYGRNRGPKLYIGVHNTSNDASVRDEVSYSKWRPDKTSTHYYADKLEIAQSLDTALCANHAGSPEGNHTVIAWELVGTNSKTRAWWLANLCWPLIAAQMAADCREFDIPPRLLTVAEMRAGNVRGFVTHDLMRQAWGGTDHTDPGKNFPMDHLLALVAAELEDDVQLTDKLRSGLTVDGAFQALLDRTNYLANTLGIAARLDKILAESINDGATSVQMSEADRTALAAQLAAAIAVPTPEQIADAVLDEDHARSAA